MSTQHTINGTTYNLQLHPTTGATVLVPTTPINPASIAPLYLSHGVTCHSCGVHHTHAVDAYTDGARIVCRWAAKHVLGWLV